MNSFFTELEFSPGALQSSKACMQIEERSSHPSERALGGRQQPDIFPGIQIDFDRQFHRTLFGETPADLAEVGVPLPPHSFEPGPVGTTQSDEVAPAAVVRPQDDPVIAKQFECAANIRRFQIGAVLAHDHDLLIPELRQGFYSVLESLTKRCAFLSVHVAGKARRQKGAGGGEKMNVDAGAFLEAKALRLKQSPQRGRPPTPLAVGVGRISKYE